MPFDGQSPTDVVNIALGLLSENRITDIDDANDPLADLAKRFYAPARNALLGLTKWHFATGWCKLTKLEETPLAGWAYQYTLPAEPAVAKIWCLDDGDAEWERAFDPLTQQQVVYTDYTNTTVGAQCTFVILDTGKWDTPAIQALASMIAADIALSRTGQTNKWQAMNARYEYWLSRATTRDGMSEGRSVPTANNMVRRRG